MSKLIIFIILFACKISEIKGLELRDNDDMNQKFLRLCENSSSELTSFWKSEIWQKLATINTKPGFPNITNVSEKNRLQCTEILAVLRNKLRNEIESGWNDSSEMKNEIEEVNFSGLSPDLKSYKQFLRMKEKKAYASQFGPMGRNKQTALQQRYESRLRHYDSNRVDNRVNDVMADLFRYSQQKDLSNKWLRPSIPDIKNISNRSNRPYQGTKVFRFLKSDEDAKNGHLSGRPMGIDTNTQVPGDDKTAKDAINQPHAALKAFTESINKDNDSYEHEEPTIVPYVPPPTVYRKVTLIQQRYSPYTLAVRLSSGCSGTLVTPLHVLTSAHCVFAVNSNYTLKVEVPESMGYRVHYVARVYIPKRYSMVANNDDVASTYIRAITDFAVITLNAPIPGRKEFPKIVALDIRQMSLMSQMHIIGYPKDNYPQMRQSSCSFLDSTSTLGGNFVMSTCLAPQGMTGASVMLDNVRTQDDMKVVGIATNMVLNDPSIIADQQRSLVLMLTPSKVAKICQQLKPWDEGRCS